MHRVVSNLKEVGAIGGGGFLTLTIDGTPSAVTTNVFVETAEFGGGHLFIVSFGTVMLAAALNNSDNGGGGALANASTSVCTS